jgi:hypothetical protein
MSGERLNQRARTPSKLRVVSWPLRDDWRRSCGLLLVILLVTALGGTLTGSFAMAALTLTIALTASWRLWIPVTFELSSQGIRRSVLGISRRIAWTQIGRSEPLLRGVLLLADAELTPLSTLRGLYIPCTREREELLESIDYFLARKRRISMSTTRTVDAEWPWPDVSRPDSTRNPTL